MSSRRKRRGGSAVEVPPKLQKQKEYENPVVIPEASIKEGHIATLDEKTCLELSCQCLARLHQLELKLGTPLSGLHGAMKGIHVIFDLISSSGGKLIGEQQELPQQDTDDVEEQDVRRDWTDEELAQYHVPEHCIPFRADIRAFDWGALAAETQFDAIMMDPPWVLATANPTRGVALGYGQLKDDVCPAPISTLISTPISRILQPYLFPVCSRKGYKVVDTVDWIKMTINRRLAKGHGFYLQHAKETCIVGLKGTAEWADTCSVPERRGQSQKPTEIYETIESLVPNGRYLEIFARRNNLRDHWVSVGLEL